MNSRSRDLPQPADQPEWDKAASEFERTTLTAVRGTADKWVGTISTILGVFGTVFVFAGPDTLAAIKPEQARTTVFIALAFAALLALGAIVAGAFAAQGIPKEWDNWNGSTYRAYVKKNTKTAASLLKFSRWLGIAAAVIVIGTALWATYQSLPSPPGTGTRAIVITETGEARCGVLTTSDAGAVLIDGDTVDGVVRVTVVDDCGT